MERFTLFVFVALKEHYMAKTKRKIKDLSRLRMFYISLHVFAYLKHISVSMFLEEEYFLVLLLI